jgi:saccharopine dehydrogenase-like NADP-dependent oxidoreductase
VNGSDTGDAPLNVAVHQVEDTTGKFEAFLSDGLRTLLTSYPDTPDMWERTLRWPGHLDTMKVLNDLGLFEPGTIADTTADTIEKRFPGHLHPDFILMKVTCRKGKRKLSWRLFDRLTGKQSAMSRTTGYITAAIACYWHARNSPSQVSMLLKNWASTLTWLRKYLMM